MNKYIISILAFFFLFIFGIKAQNPLDPVCLPDSIYADSLAGVYPGPYHPDLYPDGGILEDAVIGEPFEFLLTAVVNDSIRYSGISLKLNHLKIEENGVLNLPSGLTYACNPPNCTFESNTLGCMLIYGTPDESNELGTYDLQLASEIVAADGLITLNEILPEFLIPGSHYYLNLVIVSTENINDSYGDNFYIIENPVQDEINLDVLSNKNEMVSLELLDLQGRILKKQNGNLLSKRLTVEIGSLNLKPDSYILRIKANKFSKSFIIVVLN